MAEKFHVGVDLGGTVTKVALGNAKGEVLDERRTPTRSQEGHEAVLERIASDARELAEAAGVEVASLGIGLPGVIDIHQGIARYLPNFPGHWPDVPVRDILQGKLGYPVHVMNDVKTATLGEMVFGLGRGVRNMVFFAIGTGIGGGIVIDGQLNLGRIGSAGELGHIVVQNDGSPCGCGSRGCLETLVSGPALSAAGVRLLLSGQAPRLFEIVDGDPGRVDTRAMGLAAEQGEESVAQVIRQAGRHLGLAVAHLIVALEPELIVIGGGVAGLGDLLFDAIRGRVREAVKIYPAEGFRIEPSAIVVGAGIKGALALAMRGGLLEKGA